mgnify:CR=1 FL=1
MCPGSHPTPTLQMQQPQEGPQIARMRHPQHPVSMTSQKLTSSHVTKHYSAWCVWCHHQPVCLAQLLHTASTVCKRAPLNNCAGPHRASLNNNCCLQTWMHTTPRHTGALLPAASTAAAVFGEPEETFILCALPSCSTRGCSWSNLSYMPCSNNRQGK